LERRALAALLGVLALSPSCAAETAKEYEWAVPLGWAPPPVPAENPMTAAKVHLGRLLFYSKQLSGNGEQACVSCHEQRLGFADGLALSAGSTGERLARNSPGLANVGYFATLTWVNPLLTSLERQIPVPLLSESPLELGVTGHEVEVLERLRRDEVLESAFREAFPSRATAVSVQTTTLALASFLRTMVSANAPYDAYVAGDQDALTADETAGLTLFESRGCVACHAPPLFIGGFERTDAGRPLGLAEFTGQDDDIGRVRAAPLRNVAVTAPYMHDGRFETLEDVLRAHAGVTDTDDRRLLVAFLHALTDSAFLQAPQFSSP